MNTNLVADSIKNFENKFVGFGVKIKFVSNLTFNARRNPVFTAH